MKYIKTLWFGAKFFTLMLVWATLPLMIGREIGLDSQPFILRWVFIFALVFVPMGMIAEWIYKEQSTKSDSKKEVKE
jgi:uncharacterized membrane protein